MNKGYDAYHFPRYAFVLKLLAAGGVSKTTRVLDIGGSTLTALIRERFEIAVDTLGFGADATGADGRHFEFDLNLVQEKPRWRRDLPRYDVVVMAEVIEHLHTAPELVLAFVRTLVADNGTLILQTPNAAALPKRIKSLFGRNPNERIRLDTSDPGHFREYTVSELREIASAAGFEVRKTFTDFYFDARFAHHVEGRERREPVVGALKNAIYRSLPGSMREGITLQLTPRSSAATLLQ